MSKKVVQFHIEIHSKKWTRLLRHSVVRMESLKNNLAKLCLIENAVLIHILLFPTLWLSLVPFIWVAIYKWTKLLEHKNTCLNFNSNFFSLFLNNPVTLVKFMSIVIYRKHICTVQRIDRPTRRTLNRSKTVSFSNAACLELAQMLINCSLSLKGHSL